MRRYAFALTILGIFSLLFFLNSPPIPLSSPNDLENFQPNQKFLIQGQVVKETFSNNKKILHLSNELQLQCDLSCPTYLNKNISASVLLERYNQNNYLKILKIKTNN